MMWPRGSPRFWRALWAGGLLIGLGVVLLYTWLPADGATGDLESFKPDGFHVQWLLEEREGGLQVGDVIVSAGGYTVEEWLSGAPRGPEWRAGGVVPYEIWRQGQELVLEIRLAPVSLRSLLDHWAPQLVVALAFLLIGTFVFWRRPHELAARLLMLFCVTMMLQYLGDAYNFQYATLPWRGAFWFHLAFEHGMYGLSLAIVCYFALIFPVPHPVVERFPRLVPLALYSFFPLMILTAMVLSSDWTASLSNGNYASWFAAMVELAVAIGAGVRSARTARDPVTRAQIRWIVWCATVGCAILIPGYVLPLLITGHPLLPHPVTMLVIALVPFTFAVAILRYHLFAIEVIINRTLVYGTLTILLAGLYLLAVRLLSYLVEVGWRGESRTLAVFVATLSIALAFDPLRKRVQALIDRAFYRTKLDFQKLLPEMSERLATSIDLDRQVVLLTNELPRRLQIAWATLAVLSPDGENLVRVGGDVGHPTLPMSHALVEDLRYLGQPLLRLQPPSTLPDEARVFLDRHGVELSIPLIVGDKLVGVYSLGSKLSGNAYSGDEIRLLHLLGRQAAVAVENSRLFEAEREQRRLAEALQKAAEVVSSTLELDQVLDRILEQVERVVVGDAFNIMLISGGIAQVVRSRGYEQLLADEPIASLQMPVVDYPSLTRMMQTGKPLVIPDTASDPDWVQRAGWEWLRSYVSAPIQVAGQTVGFLNVDRTQLGQVGSADARRLEAFAHHAATALQNARLYAETQKQLGEQTALREAGAAISSTLELETVLSRIAQQMSLAVDATSAYICGFDQETMASSVLAEYISPQASALERESDLLIQYEADDQEFLDLMRAGQHDIAQVGNPELPERDRKHMEQYGARTILYIPLRIKGQLIGFTELWESRRSREFTPEEITLCHGIAQQAAIALENARLYEQAQKEIGERRRAEGQIKASLAEKEVLLKEIHHRVKNNLQVISSLLYLQSKQIEDPKTLDVFLESQHRVRSMALVHERLYQAGDLAWVNYADYVRGLASYLYQSFGTDLAQVKLRIEVDDISLGIDTAVICGLLINELVSNSLKHAFPGDREGEIVVGFHRDQEDQCSLMIHDNGIGVPKDLGSRKTESLGLRLVNSLVGQLEGALEVDRDGGTTFRITFADPKARGGG